MDRAKTLSRKGNETLRVFARELSFNVYVLLRRLRTVNFPTRRSRKLRCRKSRQDFR
jgi:hypothetical protein